MAKNEVVFMDIYCIKTRKRFHQRYDLAADDRWALTYGIKDDEFSRIVASGSASKKKVDFSNLRIGPQYKCPYCGNDSFVECGVCKKLTCYNGHELFECASCGNKGPVSGTIDSLKGSKGKAQ